MDPFQMMLLCIFTVTLVASRLMTYLHQYTNNYWISLGLPAAISIGQILTSSHDITLIEIVANYISVFFAYQFCIIIPFMLWYLRTEQITEVDPSEQE